MQPNILLIYTDQQRHDTIHRLGNSVIRTPNLGRLCEEGAAFIQATTPCPVCMPDRWSLHTGQYTSRHHCYSNHHAGPKPDFSLPGLLRNAGYRTGLIGKNHSFLTADDLDVFQPDPPRPDIPECRERDEWLAIHGKQRLVTDAVPGGLAADPEYGKTKAAIEFMRDARQPFFLWLSYLNPHTPFQTCEPFFSIYADAELPEPVVEAEGLVDKPFRQQFHRLNNDRVCPFDPPTTMRMRQVYYGMITLIDHEIGRLLDALDAQGLRESTLIIFTSDHGDYMGDHGLYTKSPAMYDCLVRIPFLMSMPGTIPAGVRSNQLISHIDILPTCLQMADAGVPEAVDGTSILPFLGDDKQIRPAAIAEYGVPGAPYDWERLQSEGLDAMPFRNPSHDSIPWEGNPVSLAGRIRMARTHDWKYVEDEGGSCELYDLRHDPHELSNLWNRPSVAEIQRRMVSLLDR